MWAFYLVFRDVYISLFWPDAAAVRIYAVKILFLLMRHIILAVACGAYLLISRGRDLSCSSLVKNEVANRGNTHDSRCSMSIVMVAIQLRKQPA